MASGYAASVFATLIGPYPQVDGTARERLVATISDQLDAGLGMLTDGLLHRVTGPRDRSRIVDAWSAADAVGRNLAEVAGIDAPLVKACLVGPWTMGQGEPGNVRAATDDLVAVIAELFAAGAPVVQLTEPALGDVEAGDVAALQLLDDVLAILTDRPVGHLSLALAGGRPTAIPHERLFAGPFTSYLFDLMHSPDDWRLCARVPPSSGLIAGVADARTADPDTQAVTVWGARYAASLGGRGPGRVGLSTSAGLELLPRDVARAKLLALAEAARMAELPDAELKAVMDPRAVDARSAALGRYEPRPGRG
jgi:hypothetical protein